jgi:hypothetical protein
MAWAYFQGRLRLCPIGLPRLAIYPVAALKSKAAEIGISAQAAQALLSLDPFASGGPKTDLPADRFVPRNTYEYAFGTKTELKESVTRETKRTTTHASFTTSTVDWQPGPVLSALGFGQRSQTTITASNATGSDVSTTVSLDGTLVSGPNDRFIVTVWYDTLFGTFAFQVNDPAPTPKLRGTGAAPLSVVKLVAGQRAFVTVADENGNYAFSAPTIPRGPASVSVGNGAATPTRVP